MTLYKKLKIWFCQVVIFRFLARFKEFDHRYQPKDIDLQIATLKQLFPELARAQVYKEKIKCPPWPVGTYIIPNWQVIAPTYPEAVKKVLTALKETLGNNFRMEPGYSPQRSSQIDQMEEVWRWSVARECLRELQESELVAVNIWLVSFADDWGLSYGNSVPLGTFAVACIFLTHPELLQRELGIACKGDRAICLGDEMDYEIPHFSTRDGELVLGGHYLEGFYLPGCYAAM